MIYEYSVTANICSSTNKFQKLGGGPDQNLGPAPNPNIVPPLDMTNSVTCIAFRSDFEFDRLPKRLDEVSPV